jgi:hypothetical protein
MYEDILNTKRRLKKKKSNSTQSGFVSFNIQPKPKLTKPTRFVFGACLFLDEVKIMYSEFDRAIYKYR